MKADTVAPGSDRDSRDRELACSVEKPRGK